MELTVIGCHGGETPRHRTCAFLLDGTLAIDAGSLTSGLELAEQEKIRAVIVSHAHLDHIRDLATLADNRCQMGAPPLVIAGTRGTLRTLRDHFFNDHLWPDFTKIPSGEQRTIEYLEITPEQPFEVAGKRVRAVMVDHTIEAASFVIADDRCAIAYSGDTGPTNRLWEVLNDEPKLAGLLMEVSFPNNEQALATASGHHTPSTLAKDLTKYARPDALRTMLYHIKPFFQAEVERECAALRGLDLNVLKLQEQHVF